MTLPPILTTPQDIDNWRPEGTLGLVPTMGALHEGHASLIRRATSECDATLVSIFVNPTQFSDPADLERYPRPFDMDRAYAARAGAAAIYAPATETIYPDGHATTISVSGITKRWEGASRPGHFDGVATVVSILLNQVRPDRSYFGEKDWQQLTMIRRLAIDLSLPGMIVGCPLVRDHDGLAISSRNARLTDHQRELALMLPAVLHVMRNLVQRGETAVEVLLKAGHDLIDKQPDIDLDYLAVVDPETLVPLDTIIQDARVLIAARTGETRLIDTMNLTEPNRDATLRTGQSEP